MFRLNKFGSRRRSHKIVSRAACACEMLEPRRMLAGLWTRQTNSPPAHTPDGTETMLLLSDGTVMVQGGGDDVRFSNRPNAASNDWFRLTPTLFGNYVDGTWTTMPQMGLQRLFYASNMLPDGRVFLYGGEYTAPNTPPTWVNSGEIYNPFNDGWSNVASI